MNRHAHKAPRGAYMPFHWWGRFVRKQIKMLNLPFLFSLRRNSRLFNIWDRNDKSKRFGLYCNNIFLIKYMSNSLFSWRREGIFGFYFIISPLRICFLFKCKYPPPPPTSVWEGEHTWVGRSLWIAKHCPLQSNKAWLNPSSSNRNDTFILSWRITTLSHKKVTSQSYIPDIT